MGITTKTGLNENGQSSSVFEGRAIGDIIPHFGTTPPPGTLVCDGSEISREAYKELYKEVGALCGPGDGSTTFELPDLRGRWMMGADAERAAGEEVAEGLPGITGSLSATNILTADIGDVERAGALSAATAEIGGTRNNTQAYQITAISFNASLSNAIYGASQHVTPASVAVLPCIVYE